MGLAGRPLPRPPTRGARRPDRHQEEAGPVILVDTGPLVALFDRKDAEHDRCVKALKSVREPLITTIPILTEAFHMLSHHLQSLENR